MAWNGPSVNYFGDRNMALSSQNRWEVGGLPKFSEVQNAVFLEIRDNVLGNVTAKGAFFKKGVDFTVGHWQSRKPPRI